MKNIKESVLGIQLFTYAAYFLLTIGFVSVSSFEAQCQSKTTKNDVPTQLVSIDTEVKDQVWSVDKVHSKVGFAVTHLVISEVEGKFAVYDGQITTKSVDFEDSVISFSVDVTSLNTDNEMRDDHLKSDDFFNAKQFPQMKFESTSFTKKGKGKYKLKGHLMIRDVSKEVGFDVKFGGIASNDGYGNTKAGFKATTTINRFDYGLKWNGLTEAGGLTVGEEVEIVLNLQFAKNK
jgi:polyisoprenoid-binding protein YceI